MRIVEIEHERRIVRVLDRAKLPTLEEKVLYIEKPKTVEPIFIPKKVHPKHQRQNKYRR